MTTSVNEAPPSHLINFGCGHPDASLLPLQEIATATQRALLGTAGDNNNNYSGQEWLQYGRENGNLKARQALADFLSTIYATDTGTTSSGSTTTDQVDPDTLFLTSGVSHGIQLVCRTLKRLHCAKQPGNNTTSSLPKPLCLVEDPTYFLIPPLLQQSGFELQAVPTDPACGLNLTVLRERVQSMRDESPHRLIVLYCIPTHHNPLGVSLSNAARMELVDLCETHGVYLIADEVYHGLGFPTTFDTEDSTAPRQQSAESPYPMAVIRDHKNDDKASSASPFVISVSAFTKILCPGIRCGWIQSSDAQLMRALCTDGVLDSGGCSSQLASGIVTQLIDSRVLHTYTKSLQQEYAERCHHLCTLLQKASFNDTFSFALEIPKGGYFVWVRVWGVDFRMDENFREHCRQHHNVDFRTGMSCSSETWKTTLTATRKQDESPKPDFSQYIRLCFAYYNVATLTLGVERLCQAIQAYALLSKEQQQQQQRPSAL